VDSVEADKRYVIPHYPAGALWAAYLDFQYQATLPRHPDPAVGNVYPLNVHGIIVYQTHDERDLLDEVLYSSVAVGLTSVLMGTIYQKKFGDRRFGHSLSTHKETTPWL
jgi:hypothetical protein